MYHVKPYYNTNDATGIDTGNVAYPMRPIYDTAPASTSSSASKDTSNMDLLARQEHLITNLEQQIRRVDQLLSEAKVSIQTTAKSHVSQAAPQAPASSGTTQQARLNVAWPENIAYPLDIVLQTDPTRLPVTPWALQKLLGKDHVMIRTHVHSSFKAANIPQVANDNGNTNRTNSSLKIIFTVIFRNVKEMEFMVDPVAQTAVSGEANLLRYICRVFPIFPALGVFEETSSDHYVDLICGNLVGGKSKERQGALKAIDEQLAKKNGHLICDKLTLADFCLHAALEKTSAKELPGNVQKWKNSIAVAF